MDPAITLTRLEIADAIHRRLGLSRAEASKMVEAILDLMREAFERGEDVKIPGFGSFRLLQKRERIGRNPKTGVKVVIPPRQVLTFRAAQRFKQRIMDADAEG